MRRGLRFWTRYTWECTYTLLGVVAVLALFTVVGTDSPDWGLLASVIPYFLVAVAVFGMVLINYGGQVIYVPLLLSMGETRRNIFLGFHYYRVLITAVTVGLCALIWALVPGQMSDAGLRGIPAILCALVASSSLGSLMGTAFSRWRWVAALGVMLVAGAGGGIAGYTFVDGIQLEQAAVLPLAGFLEKLPWWWLALAAAVLLAADAAFHWALLRRQEVKL